MSETFYYFDKATQTSVTHILSFRDYVCMHFVYILQGPSYHRHTSQ